MRKENVLHMKTKPYAGIGGKAAIEVERVIAASGVKITPMFANYQYSLSGGRQSAIQLFLRALPEEAQQTPEWELLHDMTYTADWTPNTPKFEIAGEREIDQKGGWPVGGAQ